MKLQMLIALTLAGLAMPIVSTAAVTVAVSANVHAGDPVIVAGPRNFVAVLGGAAVYGAVLIQLDPTVASLCFLASCFAAAAYYSKHEREGGRFSWNFGSFFGPTVISATL